MSDIVSEAERQRRVERMDDVKGALKQGSNVARRKQSRELKADRWTSWFRRRMDNGADPVLLLPDMCAELEERITDEVVAAIKGLKAELRKVLDGQ